MNEHPIIWTEPAPFWSEITTGVSGVAPAEFSRPAILRFANDAFMDEFLNVLATDPRRLGEYRARPETWREFIPPPTTPITPEKAFALPLQRLGAARRNLQNGRPALPTTPPVNPAALPRPLKLYQPAHLRHYLVTSCLVCEIAGLPDRRVDSGHAEKTGFVLRRILPQGAPNPGIPVTTPDEAWDEYAFVASPGGSFWQKIAPPTTAPLNTPAESYRRQVVVGEERLPLFGVKFDADDQRKRRLLAGTIPVGRREAYLAAPAATAIDPTRPAGTTPFTARKTLFRTLVSEPWKALVDRTVQFADISTTAPSAQIVETAAKGLREQIQTNSWLILADFSDFLRTYLPDVSAALTNPSPSLGGPAGDLLASLHDTTLSETATEAIKKGPDGKPIPGVTAVAASLQDALGRLTPAQVAAMEQTLSNYDRAAATDAGWPDFLFPLVDSSDLTSCVPVIKQPANFQSDPADTVDVTPPLGTPDDITFKKNIDRLAALVIRALPSDDPTPAPAPSAASQKPLDLRQAWFILRSVYERPACGPLHNDVVSARSVPFQMAGFFDPDAPARPIRIGLPIDTTPAGLRKFDKNTAFMISDVLCGQIKRLKGLTLGDIVLSVLPWPFHKDLSVPDGGPCKGGDGLNIGTICSLSIPIITICAFILLIIMVSLFDIIFRWIPYFILCFPLPGLRAKDQS